MALYQLKVMWWKFFILCPPANSRKSLAKSLSTHLFFQTWASFNFNYGIKTDFTTDLHLPIFSYKWWNISFISFTKLGTKKTDNTLINLSICGIIKVWLYFYFCHYKVFIFAFLPPAEMTCWNSNNGNVS